MSRQARALTCRELVELVTDYLEDALEHVDRRALETHVARCPGCAAYLEQIKITIGLVAAAEAARGPSQLPEGVLEAFRSWRRREAADAAGTTP